MHANIDEDNSHWKQNPPCERMWLLLHKEWKVIHTLVPSIESSGPPQMIQGQLHPCSPNLHPVVKFGFPIWWKLKEGCGFPHFLMEFKQHNSTILYGRMDLWNGDYEGFFCRQKDGKKSDLDPMHMLSFSG